MGLVAQLVQEMERDPRRFHSTGGYQRLLDALRARHDPAALQQTLLARPDLAKNLMSMIVDLDDTSAFAAQARAYLDSSDRNTAIDAMAIVLGGEGEDIRAAFDRLSACDEVEAKFAAGALAAHGLARMREVLGAAGYAWTVDLARRLAHPLPRDEIKALISSDSRDRQVVGVALAKLGRRRDPKLTALLLEADEAWIRDYGNFVAQWVNS